MLVKKYLFAFKTILKDRKSGGLGQISSDLGQAFISGLTKAFSDIQFTIEHEGTTQDFFVNKAVLAARSDYFKKMFAADPQLRVIPVKGVPPDVFRGM